MLMAADSDSPGILAVPDKASRFAATAAVPATKKKLGTKHGLPGTLVDSLTLLLEQA